METMPVTSSTTSPSPSLCIGNPRSPSDSISKGSVEDFSAASNCPSVEEPVTQEQPPDWHALLFGGKEKNCDENLSVPEMDTYYEDCKLAGDVALNLLNKYQLPVANGFREVNTNKVTSTLRSLQKSKKIQKQCDDREIVLAYMLMFDYIACCCQEGNLLSLYQNCKDEKKQYHLDLINCDLGYLLGSSKVQLGSLGWTLEQFNAAERFVAASVEKIPSRFNALYIKNTMMRKLAVLKSREAIRRECLGPYGSQNEAKDKKKKTSLAFSAFKNWDVESESSRSTSPTLKPKILHSTPKFDGTRDWTFSSSPDLAQGTVVSKSASSSHFIDTFFASGDEDSVSSSSTLASKPSNLSSHHTSTSKESFTLKTTDISDEFGNYLSDDSLPDIPIKIQKTSLKKAPAGLNPSTAISCSNTYNSSVMNEYQTNLDMNANKPKSSPCKDSTNTWKSSKYESPSKFLPPRSPMKEFVATYIPRNKQFGCSPLELVEQQENISSSEMCHK